MRTALLAFQSSLAHLQIHLALTERIVAFGRGDPTAIADPDAAQLATAVRNTGSQVFQISFDGAVLSLAASFEEFVTTLAERCLDMLPGVIARYEDLPVGISDANVKYTGEVLTHATRYQHLDPAHLVANLNSCFAGGTPYRLNSQALSLLDRNPGPTVLQEYLGERLGLKDLWNRISSCETINEWGQARTPNDTRAKAEAKLKEFMSDRNNIAHRGYGYQTLGPSSIRAYVLYFEALAPALVTTCEQHLSSLRIRTP